MPHARRRRRFTGRTSAASVTQRNSVARRRGKCRACRTFFEQGETIAVLRLPKSLRLAGACATCNHKLVGIKKYHVACLPTDWNAAMGFDPTKTYTSAPPPSAAHKVPPPPKPLTPEDAAMNALLAIETAVKTRARGNPAYIAEVEKLFKTYQGLKARALRPGTPEEGLTAMKIAMKKALDLVF